MYVVAPSLEGIIEDAKAAERLGRREEARQLYESALWKLGASEQAPLAATLLRWIARTYIDDANIEAANDCLVAALAVAEVNGDESNAAHTINAMAVTCWQRGALEEAQALYGTALQLARAASEDKLCAMIEQNLGIIANVHGDHESALRHWLVSLAGYERLGLTSYMGRALNNLGMVYTHMERWDEAEDAYARALECARSSEDLNARIMVEVNRTAFWLAQRQFTRAWDACNAANELAGKVGDERALAEINKHYGIIARERGDFANAEDRFNRALRGAEERQDLLLAAETSREQAELYWNQQRHQETLQHLNRAHRIFLQLQARPDLADVDRRIGRLEELFLNIVRGWSGSIELKDLYTRGHSDRVAEYACAIAAEAGFDDKTLFWFRMGALLHDVGKIVVPSEILNKPGTLDDDERVVMEHHPVAGAEMLRGIDFPWDVLPMVRSHHEQWGGGGYPDRLAGAAIPLSARILTIADVYDALTSHRPYRTAFGHSRAVEIMASGMGTMFDPVLFGTFVNVSDRKAGEWPIPSPKLDALLTPPRRNELAERLLESEDPLREVIESRREL